MWTFCVDYISTPDYSDKHDEKVEKLVRCKRVRVGDRPDLPRNTGIVYRRAEFRTRNGQALLNKIKRLSKKNYTVSFVMYK